MTAGGIAGLIAAAALLLLVGLLAYPIVKLGKVLDETRQLVRGVSDEAIPMLGEVNTTVTSANAQLERVDSITSNVQELSDNAAGLSSLFAATLGGPLVKVAAFSYGVRRAVTQHRRRDVERKVKAELAGSTGRRRRREGKEAGQ